MKYSFVLFALMFGILLDKQSTGNNMSFGVPRAAEKTQLSFQMKRKPIKHLFISLQRHNKTFNASFNWPFFRKKSAATRQSVTLSFFLFLALHYAISEYHRESFERVACPWA